MVFAAPWMLIGLAALALPVAIHLLDRSRSAAIDWPTLRFLRIVQQHSAQRRRLKHMLVLAARLLLLALLVLAMAMPHGRQSWGRPPQLPTTMVIVLDHSYSMGYLEVPSGQSRFERARIAAIQLIERLSIEDEVMVVLAGDKPSPLLDRPTRDHDQATELIQAAELSLGGTNLGAALSTAFALAQLDAPLDSEGPGAPDTDGAVRDSMGGDPASTDPEQHRPTVREKRRAWRQVVVVTDMQRSGWHEVLRRSLIKRISKTVPVTVIDVGDSVSPNRYVRDIRLAADSSAERLRVEVEIGRHDEETTAEEAAQVFLSIDGQKAGTPELASRSRRIRLTAPAPPPGVHRCVVEIDRDRLPIDDRAFFTLKVSGSRRITLVSGDPSQLPHLSETWFLETALRLGGDGAAALQIDHLSPQQLSMAPAGHDGCIVLANVPRLDGSALAGIENFLRGGGSAFVALGDRVVIDHYNTDWRFLPVKLEQQLGDPDRSRAYSLQIDSPGHPLFAGLLDLSATRFFAFIGADPTSLGPHAHILASFSNGSPAVIEWRFGEAPEHGTWGRVLLLTSSIDADWSNLPYRRAFLPLVDHLAGYLTARRAIDSGVALGRPIQFSGPTTLDGRPLTIIAPDGTSRTLIAELDPRTRTAVVEYRGTDQIGLYRVDADPRFTHTGAFAVNLDRAESNLDRAHPDEIREAFGDVPIRFISQSTAARGPCPAPPDATLDRNEVRYWPWLLLAAVLVFTLETLLANFFTRRRAAGERPGTTYVARGRA